MPEPGLIQGLFRSEHGKIVSVLVRAFGIIHSEIAEDIVKDTFLAALESWESKGIPENPQAWLYAVAKNKAKDHFRREKLFSERIAPEIIHLAGQEGEPAAEPALDLSEKNIVDSQLQMIFTICNPEIPVEAQIGLALRILCGFGIEEIAAAFLTTKETINKRLFRAKERLRSEAFRIESLSGEDIQHRLEAVLATLYLLFNEGYHSSTQDEVFRKSLCVEAMQLNHFLVENPLTNRPEANALLSLMCFHSSRFAARKGDAGLILYGDQDRSLWDDALIAKGNYFLIESAKGQVLSKYHLEASIAYWHCTRLEPADKWERILQLYNQLLQLEYSPIAALNRTYAFSRTHGKEAAIREAEKLCLSDSHLYHALLGHLYSQVDSSAALRHYRTALEMAKTAGDRKVIENAMQALVFKHSEGEIPP